MSLVVGTNSYISVANANTYFEDLIHADSWASATSETRSKALITATKMLDRRYWAGTKYQAAPTQVLDWPRSGITDPEGVEVAEDTVPQFILDATCELALALVEDSSLQSAEDSDSIRSIRTGTVSVEFFGSKATDFMSTGFPQIVQELINYYLAGANDFSGPFASGTDNESELEDFDRDRGF